MRTILFALALMVALGSSANAPPRGNVSSPAPNFQGVCDLVTCAVAHSVTRSAKAGYTGNLFRLYNGSTTLDIGQVARIHSVDLSTYRNFCGGSWITQTVNGISVLTSTTCVYAILYDEINGNNLIPSVFNATGGPDCSGGGAYKCAAPFMIETATGLPVINTVSPQKYTLSGDVAATGVPVGHNSVSVVAVGSGPSVAICCGYYGIYHIWDAGVSFDPSDFALGAPYGNGTFNSCATSTTHCLEIDGEGAGGGGVLIGNYGTTQINTIAAITYSSGTENVTGWINGTQLFSATSLSAPRSNLTSIHLGGGGDLTDPAPAVIREAYVFNSSLSSGDIAAIKADVAAFYPSLTFP